MKYWWMFSSLSYKLPEFGMGIRTLSRYLELVLLHAYENAVLFCSGVEMRIRSLFFFVAAIMELTM